MINLIFFSMCLGHALTSNDILHGNKLEVATPVDHSII